MGQFIRLLISLKPMNYSNDSWLNRKQKHYARATAPSITESYTPSSSKLYSSQANTQYMTLRNSLGNLDMQNTRYMGYGRSTLNSHGNPLSMSLVGSFSTSELPQRHSYDAIVSDRLPESVRNIRKQMQFLSIDIPDKETQKAKTNRTTSYLQTKHNNVPAKQSLLFTERYLGSAGEDVDLRNDIKSYISNDKTWTSTKGKQYKENLQNTCFKKHKNDVRPDKEAYIARQSIKQKRYYKTPKQTPIYTEQIEARYPLSTTGRQISKYQYLKNRESVQVPSFLSNSGQQAIDFMRGDFKHFSQKLSKSNRLSISNFQIGSCKGDGKFGKVYPCRDKLTGTLYALKQIPKQLIKKSSLQNQFVWEVKLQSLFKHPNIVKLYAFFSDSTNIYLLLEYMEGGTLFDYLKKFKPGGLPQKQVSLRMKEICSAVYYMHDMEVAHRDIKPQNIVLSNGVAKLCDFGWATLTHQRRKTYCGTFDYSSPQMLQGKEYDESVDLWSLGVLAYQLLTGKLPFYSISRKQTMQNIVNVEKKSISFPADVSWQARSFIQGLLRKEPLERCQADMLLKHPFLQKYQQNII